MDFLMRMYANNYLATKTLNVFRQLLHEPETNCYLCDYKLKNSTPDNNYLYLTLPSHNEKTIEFLSLIKDSHVYENDYVLDDKRVVVIIKYNSQLRMNYFLESKYSKIYETENPEDNDLFTPRHLSNTCFGILGLDETLHSAWHILTKSPQYLDYLLETLYEEKDIRKSVIDNLLASEFADKLDFEKETLNYHLKK